MKRVPQKGIHNNIKNERRSELINRHAALKDKEEEENDECKKELEQKCRDIKSACEESSNFIEKIKLEHDYKKCEKIIKKENKCRNTRHEEKKEHKKIKMQQAEGGRSSRMHE